MHNSASLVKIGVFYDGSFFQHVSNYYYFNHPRHSRIRISGLHDFIRHVVADEENRDVRNCQIVDCHLFKGRLYAGEATENQIYYDRVFDDILMSEGVVTHYLPLRSSWSGKKMEKGIDVWLALEAYELCVLKHFDVVVLIASDGDYAPLIRKVNSLGSRMMVLSWEFDFINEEGNTVYTRTSHELLNEASYPIAMHKIIENPDEEYASIIKNIFVQGSIKSDAKEVIGNFEAEKYDSIFDIDSDMSSEDDNLTSNKLSFSQSSNILHDENLFINEANFDQKKSNLSSNTVIISYILSLKNGYGFIKYPPNNLFFHFSKLTNSDFSQLHVGDKVEFSINKNETGEDIAVKVRKIEDYGADAVLQ